MFKAFIMLRYTRLRRGHGDKPRRGWAPCGARERIGVRLSLADVYRWLAKELASHRDLCSQHLFGVDVPWMGRRPRLGVRWRRRADHEASRRIRELTEDDMHTNQTRKMSGGILYDLIQEEKDELLQKPPTEIILEELAACDRLLSRLATRFSQETLQ